MTNMESCWEGIRSC